MAATAIKNQFAATLTAPTQPPIDNYDRNPDYGCPQPKADVRTLTKFSF